MFNITNKLFELIDTNAILRGNFTLSSGIKTEYFVDSTQVTMSVFGASVVADLLQSKIGYNYEVDAVGGIAISSIPILGALSALYFYDTFYIKKSKDYTRYDKQIEGIIGDYTKNVVLIDDVVTTGNSLINGIRILNKNFPEVKVKKLLCVVYREEENAEQRFKNLDYEFEYLFKLSDFINKNSEK